MKRYLKIYYCLLKFMLISETSYRFNFFMELFVESAYIFVSILGIRVILWNIKTIGGWDFNQMLVLMGIYSMFSEIVLGTTFILNLRRLPEKIASGDLDLILSKPINSQFVVSLWQPYFALIPSCLPGLAMILLGFKLGGFVFNPILLLPFLLLFCSGLVMAYSLGMIISTFSFWLVNASPLPQIAEHIISIAERPYSIFGGAWKIVFLFFIPLAFMATFPAQALLGSFEWQRLILGVFLAGVFLKASNLFWNFGLKHYQSASS